MKVRIKTSRMYKTAIELIKRAQGTTSGTWIYVGYHDGSISATQKVLKGMPHERVNVLPGQTVDEVELALAVAAAKVRAPITKTLEKRGVVIRKQDRKAHAWGKGGTIKGRKS